MGNLFCKSCLKVNEPIATATIKQQLENINIDENLDRIIDEKLDRVFEKYFNILQLNMLVHLVEQLEKNIDVQIICKIIVVGFPKINYYALPPEKRVEMEKIINVVKIKLAEIKLSAEFDGELLVLKSYFDNIHITERTTFLCSLVHAGLLKSEKYPEKYVKPANNLKNSVLSVPELQREICLYL